MKTKMVNIKIFQRKKRIFLGFIFDRSQAEDGVMQPLAKESWQLPESGRDKEQILF